MGILDLYTDYNISTAPQGHKHNKRGWVNCACPHCGSSGAGYHLGFNLKGAYFYCWIGGKHDTIDTLSKLVGTDQKSALKIAKDYKIRKSPKWKPLEATVHENVHPFKLPSDCAKLKKPHKRYLENRGFDPEEIESKWKVMGTGPMSSLDDGEGTIIPYKYRILIPIYWEDELVTYQARDYTEKQSLKYLACPKTREKVHHKDIIYGNQRRMKGTGMLVEGALDVWRFGYASCSTLGVSYTPKQVVLLSKLFDRLFVLYDNEPLAQEKADQLINELIFAGVDAYNFSREYEGTDPAVMKQDDANHLIKELKLL